MRHLAMALVAVLALGACTDDDEESANEDERSGESPQGCDALAVLADWSDAVQEAINREAGSTGTVPLNAVLLDDREEVEAAYSDLAETVPDELRDNAETVGDFSLEYLDLVADGASGNELLAYLDADEDTFAAWEAVVRYSSAQCNIVFTSPAAPRS